VLPGRQAVDGFLTGAMLTTDEEKQKVKSTVET
jgi:hypothetical protein